MDSFYISLKTCVALQYISFGFWFWYITVYILITECLGNLQKLSQGKLLEPVKAIGIISQLNPST